MYLHYVISKAYNNSDMCNIWTNKFLHLVIAAEYLLFKSEMYGTDILVRIKKNA